MAILLFIVPARDKDGNPGTLLDWPTFLKTPWDILLLFGGGVAIADAFKETGLSSYIGGGIAELSDLPPMMLVLASVLLVTFLTEITSNTATANILLPIMGATACEIGVSPTLLMVPTALACSCAFMLPIATAPNAIAFATKRFSLMDMASSGFLINIVSAFLITAWMFTWGLVCFDMEEHTCEASGAEALSMRTAAAIVT